MKKKELEKIIRKNVRKNVRKVLNIMSTKRQKIKDNMNEKIGKTELNQMDIF